MSDPRIDILEKVAAATETHRDQTTAPLPLRQTLTASAQTPRQPRPTSRDCQVTTVNRG